MQSTSQCRCTQWRAIQSPVLEICSKCTGTDPHNGFLAATVGHFFAFKILEVESSSTIQETARVMCGEKRTENWFANLSSSV